MSDLISREKIRDYIKGEINPYGKPFEGTAYELGLKIMRYIDAMDSDYDVEKVVEELETDPSVKLYGSGNSDNYLIPVKRVIKIVKQGGVYDDVCEWKVKSNYYVTKCSHDTDIMYGLKSDFKFCPFCGKKIKVVEEMDEEDFRYCHHDDTDEYHDCLDYIDMECEECPYYYSDLD